MIKTISKIIIFFIIFFGFFFRSFEDFTLFSPGKATILFSMILILFTDRNFWRYFSKDTRIYIFFIIVILLTVLVSFKSSLISFYFFELLALIFIYTSGKIASYRNINIMNLILIASILVGLIGILNLIQNPVNSFRRLALAGGYNYSASNFALAATIALYIYLQRKNKLFGLLTILLVVFTITQGSRQAILGLLIAAIILLYNKNKKIMIKISLGFVILGAIAFTYLSQFENLTLLQRFSSDHISSSADSRFVLWYQAIFENQNIFTFLIGTPENNSLINSKFINNDLFNPHNLFVSTYRYHGFFAMLTLFLLVIQVFINRKIDLIYKLFFFITLWYLTFSGELTRSFHFIFILGFCHGNIYNNLQPFRGKRAKC